MPQHRIQHDSPLIANCICCWECSKHWIKHVWNRSNMYSVAGGAPTHDKNRSFTDRKLMSCWESSKQRIKTCTQPTQHWSIVGSCPNTLSIITAYKPQHLFYVGSAPNTGYNSCETDPIIIHCWEVPQHMITTHSLPIANIICCWGCSQQWVTTVLTGFKIYSVFVRCPNTW